MSIIETNTEQLQEVLQQVYNLPNRSGGGSAYDLVIGLNVANTKTQNSSEWFWQLSDMAQEDVSVVSGNVSTVAEKIRQGLPVKVALVAIHFYSTMYWYNTILDAFQTTVIMSGETRYPETEAFCIVCKFMAEQFAEYPSTAKTLGSIHIALSVSTGEVLSTSTHLWMLSDE